MLKINIGLSRKIGGTNYSSRGASVNLEMEVESGLVQEPAKLQERIRYLFSLAKQSVEEELNGDGQHGVATSDNGDHPQSSSNNGSNGHQATEKQLGYARQLAGQIQGLGVRKLESLANKMFSKPVADLSTLDASGLIDTLKEIKAGEINLEVALNGAAS
ncbi:MAG: hypothetical protein N2C12_01855 [Planctomycetales bacterium]